MKKKVKTNERKITINEKLNTVQLNKSDRK